jgi:regulatory protein
MLKEVERMTTNPLQRITSYCAESERCTHDAVSKLKLWGASPEEIEVVLNKLYAEKFIDDKRFALSYVSEKWNLDRWGKIKIANALEAKMIDEKIIQDSLDTISDEDYIQGLNELLRKKSKEISAGKTPGDARRLLSFALSRGFEEELVMEWLEAQGYEM